MPATTLRLLLRQGIKRHKREDFQVQAQRGQSFCCSRTLKQLLEHLFHCSASLLDKQSERQQLGAIPPKVMAKIDVRPFAEGTGHYYRRLHHHHRHHLAECCIILVANNGKWNETLDHICKKCFVIAIFGLKCFVR